MEQVTWADSLQAIGNIIGAVFSVLAFIILVVQLRQIVNTIKSQNHSSIYQIGLQLNNLLIENSELMPYFLGTKKLKEDSSEFHKCRLICESLLDYYEYVHLEKSRIDNDLLEYYGNYIKIMYNRNVLMQEFLMENIETYDKDFVKLITSKIKK